jgi:hypothetical protein
MTFTCTATRLKQTITECGLSEKERDTFLKKYKTVGFDTFYNVEGTKHHWSALDALEFYNEHLATTIEIDLTYANQWMERRHGNG